MKNPTSQNLELVAQINNVLGENTAEATVVDQATILRYKIKGRLVAALFFLIILVVAILMYLTMQ